MVTLCLGRRGLVVCVVLLVGCTKLPVAPADDGIDYSYVNRCPGVIIVELNSGSRPRTLAPGGSGLVRTLDEQADSEFVVSDPETGAQVRFKPGAESFVIEGKWCP